MFFSGCSPLSLTYEARFVYHAFLTRACVPTRVCATLRQICLPVSGAPLAGMLEISAACANLGSRI
jgi:hypothetical protein